MINRRNKGVSLITLMITIVVVIILAAVAILNIGKNNIDTNEALFKHNLKTYDEQVDIAVQTEFITNQDILDEIILGKENIEKYSKELSESKYIDWVFIKDGKLTIKRTHGFTEEQIEWAREIDIEIEGAAEVTDTVSLSQNPNKWVDGEGDNVVNVTISYENIPDGYIIQYSLDSGNTWYDGTEAKVTKNNTMVIGRLWFEKLSDAKGEATHTVNTIDEERPTIPTLEVIERGINHIKVKASKSIDTQSGVSGYRFSQTDLTEEEWKQKEQISVVDENKDGIIDESENYAIYEINGIKAASELTLYVVSVDGVNRISNPAAVVTTSTTTAINNVKIEADNSFTRGPVNAKVTYLGEDYAGYKIAYKTYTIGENVEDISYTIGENVTVNENNTVIQAALYNKELDDEIAVNSMQITTIDKEAPTVPTSIEIIRDETNLQVKASGSQDVGVSGLAGYQYSINGKDWSGTIAASSYYTIPNLQVNSSYTVYARAVDNLEEKSSLPSEVYKKTNVTTLSTYSVTYNSNTTAAVGNMPTAQTKVESKTLKLSTNTPTRTGYTFAGWATSSSGNVAYSVGSNYTADGAVTLYAKWTPITYTVAYNANGGSGSMASVSHTYDVAKNLTSNAFTKTGYKFLGWATSSSGSVVYSNGQSVKNLRNAAGTITLYAKWQLVHEHTTSCYHKHTSSCYTGGGHTSSCSYVETVCGASYSYRTSSASQYCLNCGSQMKSFSGCCGSTSSHCISTTYCDCGGSVWKPSTCQVKVRRYTCGGHTAVLTCGYNSSIPICGY